MASEDFDRTPPQDIDAEMSVLGSPKKQSPMSAKRFVEVTTTSLPTKPFTTRSSTSWAGANPRTQ